MKPIIHFEDGSTRPEVFRMQKARITAAAKRNKDAAALVDVSCGQDLAGLQRWIGKANGLVCASANLLDKRFPLRNLAEVAPQLKWIHVIGAGVEGLMPLDWLHPGLKLTNNSGVHVKKVYEFGLMSLLMINAQVPRIYSNQMRREWNQVFTGSPRGKTLLVVGLGEMGGAMAKAGRTLGMRVLGIRRTPSPHPHAEKVHGIRDLKKLLPKADVVVVAAPLTPESRRLIGRTELALMKPGAGLINIGRGPVLDQAAVEKALRSGHLSGAVLDVFDPEPLPRDSTLWTAPNVYLSPHCSSDDNDEYMPMTLDLAFANAKRLALGRKLANVVDPARGY
ncbi:MAG: D-2-hydroxyacid dehydrogenase [Betaproteobacteria bacterium]|nr:D-2-hydroxyacid dehydrogenase [Betaproteobacteria bacterium]